MRITGFFLLCIRTTGACLPGPLGTQRGGPAPLPTAGSYRAACVGDKEPPTIRGSLLLPNMAPRPPRLAGVPLPPWWSPNRGGQLYSWLCRPLGLQALYSCHPSPQQPSLYIGHLQIPIRHGSNETGCILFGWLLLRDYS